MEFCQIKIISKMRAKGEDRHSKGLAENHGGKPSLSLQSSSRYCARGRPTAASRGLGFPPNHLKTMVNQNESQQLRQRLTDKGHKTQTSICGAAVPCTFIQVQAAAIHQQSSASCSCSFRADSARLSSRARARHHIRRFVRVVDCHGLPVAFVGLASQPTSPIAEIRIAATPRV